MIVLDCSATVEMVLGTEAGLCLRSLMLGGEQAISSSLLHAEAASVYRKYVRANVMTQGEALAALNATVRLVDCYVDVSENHVEAFAESLRLEHSPYDLLYFTLARRNGATLFTLDRKLLALCEREGLDCVHVLAA
jgi:predicted nucleic acid-binding protein